MKTNAKRKKENKKSEPKEKNDNKDNKKDGKKSNKKKIIIASCAAGAVVIGIAVAGVVMLMPSKNGQTTVDNLGLGFHFPMMHRCREFHLQAKLMMRHSNF